jgi:foldase protein PrsA
MWLNRRHAAFRGLAALALACVLAGTLAACGGKDGGGVPGEGQGEPVATYQGKTVTDTEFNKYLSLLELTSPMEAMYIEYIPGYKEQILERYIIYKEYAAKASSDDVKQAEESAAAIRGQLDEVLKDEAQKESIQQILDKSGLTTKEAERLLKMLISGELAIDKKFREIKNAVTEDEVRAEFEKAPSDYNIVTVRHILVATTDSTTGEEKRTEEEALARAKEARAKLIAGGSWEELAAEYSDDPGSKNNGGLYADARPGDWVEEFKQAANTQPVGVIGEPVLTSYGYHVIKVEKREEMTFDKLPQDKKDAIRESLARPKLNEEMEKELEALGIEISLPQEETPAGEDGGEAPQDGAEGESDGNADGEAGGGNAGGAEGDKAQ